MQKQKAAQEFLFNKSFFESRISFYILLFISVLLIFNDLSKPGLPSNDDCAKAQRGWEMLQSGDFLTPRLAGKSNFDHPPLYIGMLASSMAVFGKTEFAARFPGALCAFLVILAVYQIGKVLKNRTAGWWAGFFLVTSYIFLKISRRVQADIPFMLFATLAMMFFIRAVKKAEMEKDDQRKTIWLEFAGFGLCAGLSGLIKSVFIAFPLGIPFVFLLVNRRFLKKLYLPYLASSTVAVITAGWWYLYEFLLYKNRFVEEFIGKFLKHHAGGGSRMGKYGYFGYLYEFTRHFLPWLPLLFLCIWWAAKSEKIRKNMFVHLLAIYAVLPVFALSFFGDKAIRYILFIFAPVVLIMALVLTEKLHPNKLVKYARIAVISVSLISAFVIIRPVDYKDIPNSSYMVLSDLIEKGSISMTDGDEIYYYGTDADFKGNYRGLLYYTELELKGMLRSDNEVTDIINRSKPFYLVLDKREINEFLLNNLQVVADLGGSLLMRR
jgi:4-amino-4-deoxy-L-arabinose transferase-like glycosyltransferase